MTDYTTADQNAVALLGLAVSGTSLVQILLAAPGGESIAVARMAVSLSELRPSAPFDRASNSWETLRDELDDYRTFVIGLTKGVGKDAEDGAWSGPGSEAMQEFVEDDLAPGIKGMVNASDDAEKVCKELAEKYQTAVEEWFLIAAGTVAALLVAKALLKVPYIGAVLNAAANLGIELYGLYLDTQTLGTLFSDLGDSMTKAKDLIMAIEGLGDILGKVGGNLDDPLDSEFGKIESDVSDPDNWDKA